jgi:hypothetical protein
MSFLQRAAHLRRGHGNEKRRASPLVATLRRGVLSAVTMNSGYQEQIVKSKEIF